MAARFLLLGILFTEVLRPAAPAGVRVNGAGPKSGPKSAAEALPAALEIRPRGEAVLGRRGLTLSCPGHADVSWSYNGAAAPPCGPARCTLLRNGSLRLYKKKNSTKNSMVQKRKGNDTLGSRSSGRNEYRCVARTSYGASFRSAPTNILHAELAHVFKESPANLTVYEGEVSRFSCMIDSIPFPPNITWMHNGEVISNEQNNTKYAFIPPGVLYIKETILSDAGSYRCVATNEFLNTSKKSKEAKLTVISSQDKESYNPISLFPQSSYKYSTLNGTSLRLACAASGYPPSLTMWTFLPKHENAEAIQRRILRNSSAGSAILDLINVTASDAGIYICSMKNAENNSSNLQNITVEILVPPSFVKRPANQIWPNGKTARFECQAQGYPTPDIYWLKNSENITINGRRSVYGKDFNKVELAISATVPSDSGIYQCVAVNAAGEIWAAGRLQVNTSRNSPAAPTSLKCEALSPIKMFISWEPPRFLPFTNITAYTVHYRPVEGGKEEVSPPEPGNSTSVEITKLLEPFTNYTFYVRLWNNHGASDQSATITCSTNASVPKVAPKISVNVISSTKLNITWKPLTKKEAQGIVVEYKLEWRLFQHPDVRILILPADVKQYILADLKAGKKYDIRVLARTQQGWPSELQLGWVTVTMPSSNDLTQLEILILNSTTIKAIWSTKIQSVLQFTSWKIYCKNEQGNAVISDDLTNNITEYLFTNLESDTPYTIELCAFNLEEKVPCSTKRVDLKKISGSNAPNGLEAVPISSTAISLSWISGNSNDYNTFQVCYHAVHFLNESSTCIPVNCTKAIINDLKPFMLYQFKVKALNNDSKEDRYSETIECYTNEDVPGKIEDIWFFINGTNVRIAWKEPNNINGIIQSYIVAYSMDRSAPWTNITVQGNKTSASLTGLMSGKRYFVIVQAGTKAGFGRPSEPIIVETSGSSSEAPSLLDEQKPLPKSKEDKRLGVILGIGISMFCIVMCLCSMYCRKKYESLRSLRESAQPLKNRVLTRNGNSCCVDHRSSTSVNQSAVMSNEIELAVLCPSTPLSTNPLCDTKGGHANGLIESCAKQPLLAPWEMNGIRKDLRITENPQYKPREVDNSNKSQLQLEELPDLNSTQLTSINHDSDGSDESLNNNMSNHTSDGNESLPLKTAPPIVPVLEPNG